MIYRGRPKDYTAKNVIDMYVSFTGGTVPLKASIIAEYAENELGLTKFKYYTIKRNFDTSQYMKELNEKISGM